MMLERDPAPPAAIPTLSSSSVELPELIETARRAHVDAHHQLPVAGADWTMSDDHCRCQLLLWKITARFEPTRMFSRSRIATRTLTVTIDSINNVDPSLSLSALEVLAFRREVKLLVLRSRSGATARARSIGVRICFV